MHNNFYVYILTNNSETLYIGVTNNLERRLFEHKEGLISGFTQKYNLKKLIYYEHTSDVKAAIAREKQLKGWTRKKKLDLIMKINPQLQELDSSADAG